MREERVARHPAASRAWLWFVGWMLCWSQTWGASVTLAWDPNTEPDIAGYKLYYGSPAGNFSEVVNVGNATNTTVSTLLEGSTYAFYVTCYNSSGLESEPSNVVEYTVPTAPPVNHAPTAANGSVAVVSGQATVITLEGFDADGDPLSFNVASFPAAGSLAGYPEASGSTATIEYQSLPGFVGTDSFTFNVDDGYEISGDATISITVTLPNTPPVALAREVETQAETAVPIQLGGTDEDGDPLTYVVVTQPLHGILTGTPPSVIYTPVTGYAGTDAFTFRVHDGQEASDAAVVNLTVSAAPPANLAPLVEAGPDIVVTWPVQAILRGAVSDDGLPAASPGPTVRWTQVEGPATAEVSRPDNAFTKVRFNKKANGRYVFRLTASDGELTASDALAVQVGELAASAALAEPFTLYVEAETGELLDPLQALSDPAQPETRYVATTTSEQGRARYDFEIPQEGDFLVWCRVRTTAGSADSFYVTVDDDPATRDIYDASEEEYGDSWKWTALGGRGGADQPFEYAYSLAPRIFRFTAGLHALAFEGREPGTALDAFVVTSDPLFDPTAAETSTEPPVASLAPNLTGSDRVLSWLAIPGRHYQVLYQDSLQPGTWQPLTPALQAAQTTATVTDAETPVTGSRFYRIVLLP